MPNAQKTHKFMTALTAGFAAAGFAAAVMAAGVDANVDADVDAKTGAKVVVPGNAEAGATAESHMSPSGQANSNAQWRDDATRGADRASERLERERLEAGASGEADAGARSGTR